MVGVVCPRIFLSRSSPCSFDNGRKRIHWMPCWRRPASGEGQRQQLWPQFGNKAAQRAANTHVLIQQYQSASLPLHSGKYQLQMPDIRRSWECNDDSCIPEGRRTNVPTYIVIPCHVAIRVIHPSFCHKLSNLNRALHIIFASFQDNSRLYSVGDPLCLVKNGGKVSV